MDRCISQLENAYQFVLKHINLSSNNAEFELIKDVKGSGQGKVLF